MYRKGGFINKIMEKVLFEQGEVIVPLTKLDQLPFDLQNSILIQNGLSPLIDRDKLPKGSRVLSKEHTKIYSSGKCIQIEEPNLLEIKLKDTDSVPEVYYKGNRLDETPKGLVDISYHWRTNGFSNDDYGIQDIHIDYYETPDDQYLDKKTIEHHRDM